MVCVVCSVRGVWILRGVVCDEWMWCGVVYGVYEVCGDCVVSERLVRCVRRVCAARGACRGTGTTQSKEHSVDECGWASNELHEQPKPNPRTEVQQRTKQQNAEATGYRTTADPKARNISTGTAHSTHPTHTHTHNAQAKAARWAGRALGFRGVLNKAQQRGAGPA